jgi:DNA-binding phage protein
MSLTQDFTLTVRSRARDDHAFRAALLAEAAEAFLSGDASLGRALLADLIQATESEIRLSEKTGMSVERIAASLGDNGRPHADEIFAIFAALQKEAGVHLAVKPAA